VRRALALVGVLLVHAGVAMADPHSPAAIEAAKRAARRLLEEGNQLFAKERFREALTRYKAAYEAYASPKILLNIGAVYEAMGDPINAASTYDRALHQPDLLPETKKDATQRLEAIDGKLARLVLRGAAAEGAAVEIDGVMIGRMPLPPQRLLTGPHDIRARLAGHSPFHLRVMGEAGQTMSIEVVLTPEQGAPPPESPPLAAAPQAPPPTAEPPPAPSTAPAPEVVAAPPPGEEPEGGITSQWWFWTVLVAVAAGGTAAVIATRSSSFDLRGSLGPPSSILDWEKH
jgi:hypothetical protein